MISINIGFLVYPDVVQLDVMGAYQVLSFPPNAKIYLVAKNLNPLVSSEGLIITPTKTLDDCPSLDVICVPGGGMGQIEVMKDQEILNFLRQQSRTARFTTSVCTGSLILAAANLLQGYKATCHWALREQLAMFGVEVILERVVIDRNFITGAGVTSGIDFGLTVLSLLWGEEMAKMAQVGEQSTSVVAHAQHLLTESSAIRDHLTSALQQTEVVQAETKSIAECAKQSSDAALQRTDQISQTQAAELEHLKDAQLRVRSMAEFATKGSHDALEKAKQVEWSNIKAIKEVEQRLSQFSTTTLTNAKSANDLATKRRRTLCDCCTTRFPAMTSKSRT